MRANFASGFAEIDRSIDRSLAGPSSTDRICSTRLGGGPPEIPVHGEESAFHGGFLMSLPVDRIERKSKLKLRYAAGSSHTQNWREQKENETTSMLSFLPACMFCRTNRDPDTRRNFEKFCAKLSFLLLNYAEMNATLFLSARSPMQRRSRWCTTSCTTRASTWGLRRRSTWSGP